MMKYIVSLFFIISTATAMYGLEWPVDTPVFSRFFGQCVAADSFEQGIAFESPAIVRAADNGSVLITIEKKYAVRNFPSTLGNAVIFSHEDGLQTIYANLETHDRFQERKHSEMGSVIGFTGVNAWGSDHNLQFQVIDTQKKNYINPLLLFPAIDDTVKPKINGVFLMDAQNQLIPLGKQKTIAQGVYTLYTAIADMIDNDTVHRFNPFRITVFVNGRNIWTVPFETITCREGQLYLSNTSFSSSLLYQQQQELICAGKVTLNRGKSDIMIVARDITGNESTEHIVLQIE